ncbi:hypothetical protein ACWN56_05270 [Weissella viridescens]|uniref:Uncharacterized protein n=1 Tax=Weissella viridescens TaxID=1629 RepID=A0A380P960_WEIVI|nr:hypothetical protein [Weissella viridescens]SUP61387.1 Uncharacterised protein [Weissella viridescens]
MESLDLDKEAKARGYENWSDLEYDYGKNYANELKQSLESDD